jgi:hypothetical protein
MARDEIMIYLKDETEDSKLSQTKVEETVAKVATTPQTEKVIKKIVQKSKMNLAPLKQIGTGAMNIATGGTYSGVNSLLGSVVSATAVSALALSLAQQAIQKVEELRRERLEWQNNQIRSGGSRENANISGGRISILTGRVNGQSTIYKR